MIFFSTLLLSMFITIALIPILKGWAIKFNAMDFPSERKVHRQPMPKVGGVSMAMGVLIPALLWAPDSKFVSAVFVGAGIVFICGFIDDVKDLGYIPKFMAQIAAALLVILYGGLKIKYLGMLLPNDILLPEWIAIPLTLIVIIGITNAINLSDGLDGLAGGISLFIFICIGYLAYKGGNAIIVLFTVAVSGAIFGFLRFNTHPATVFMGDAGSQFLGFLAATLSLRLTQGNTPLNPLLPLILLGFPVLDTLTVMFERIANKRSPFLADKNHFHHKLMRLGLYHTEAVFIIYLIQAVLVISAFMFRFYSEWLLLFLYTIFAGITLSFFFIADKAEIKFKRPGFLDRIIKERLKFLKDKSIIIRLSFSIIAAGMPLLLLSTCFLPAVIPRYFAIISICIACLMLLVWFFKKEKMAGPLRLSFYLLIPFLIYLSEADMVAWMTKQMKLFYNLSFGFLVFFVIVTLRFTRREKGFRATPTDFLILFIALAVPLLPDEQIQSHHMGLLAAKTIALFFSCEVLIGELRNELDRLGLATIAALLVISIRGFI